MSSVSGKKRSGQGGVDEAGLDASENKDSNGGGDEDGDGGNKSTSNVESGAQGFDDDDGDDDDDNDNDGADDNDDDDDEYGEEQDQHERERQLVCNFFKLRILVRFNLSVTCTSFREWRVAYWDLMLAFYLVPCSFQYMNQMRANSLPSRFRASIWTWRQKNREIRMKRRLHRLAKGQIRWKVLGLKVRKRRMSKRMSVTRVLAAACVYKATLSLSHFLVAL